MKTTRFTLGLRSVWALLAISLLFYILVHVDEKDADIVFIVGMTALTLPVGIAVALLTTAILGVVLIFFGVEVANSVPFYLAVWSVYVAVGYAQWFWFLPKLRRKLKSRAASGHPGP